MTTIARATNDKGKVVELIIEEAPEDLTPWPYRNAYKLIIDGETVLDADFCAQDAARSFFDACAVEKK